MLYLKKKTYSNLRKYNFSCLFPRSPLVYKNIFTDDYYPSRYFHRRGITRTIGWLLPWLGKFDVLKTNIYFRDKNTLLSLFLTTKFSSALVQKPVELFSTFWHESRESKIQNLKKKTDKTMFTQFWLFIFYKPACLLKEFYVRLLSIGVFSADGHYLTIECFCRGTIGR